MRGNSLPHPTDISPMRAPPRFRAYIPAAVVALSPIALFWSSIPQGSRYALLVSAIGIFALLFVIVRSSRRTKPLIRQRLDEADAIRRDRYLLLDSLKRRSESTSPTLSITSTPPIPDTRSSS